MSTNDHYFLAAIGPVEIIIGLKAIGVDVFPAANRTDAIAQLKKVRASNVKYAAVLITDTVSKLFSPEELRPKDTSVLPLILVIPDLQSNEDFEIDKLRNLTRKAIGSDIVGA